MNKKKRNQAKGILPQEKKIQVSENVCKMNEFALAVIKVNPASAAVLENELDKYHKNDHSVVENFIACFVASPEDYRQKFFSKHLDNPIIFELMVAALLIRVKLGLAHVVDLSDINEV